MNSAETDDLPFAKSLCECRLRIEAEKDDFRYDYQELTHKAEAAPVLLKTELLVKRFLRRCQFVILLCYLIPKRTSLTAAYWISMILLGLIGLSIFGLGILAIIGVVGFIFSVFSTPSKTESFQPNSSEGYAISSSDAWQSTKEVVNDPRFWEFAAEVAFSFLNDAEPKSVHVDSYTDKNGRFVPEHYRSKPEQE